MRKEGWAELLATYIETAMAKEFAYGSHDCALFCADWIQIATGVDYAKDLRGYGSVRQAYRIVAKFGSVKAMATALIGVEPIHGAWAQRGDIVLMDNPKLVTDLPEASATLGICLGRSSAFPAVRGLWMLSTLEAAAAWKIR